MNGIRTAAWFATALLLTVFAAQASAWGFGGVRRVPQVPLQGAAVQAILDPFGSNVNAYSDQDSTTLWGLHPYGSEDTVLIDWHGGTGTNTFGLYGVADGAPVLVELFGPTTPPESGALLEFRRGLQPRVTVYLAPTYTSVTRRTLVGIHRSEFGFYLQSSQGTYFSQDFRNPGGAAHAVSYCPILHWPYWLICFEDTPADSAADRDFIDAIVGVEFPPAGLPVVKTTWGRIKSLGR